MPHSKIVNLIAGRIKLELEEQRKRRKKEIEILHLDIRRKGQVNGTPGVLRIKEFCSQEINRIVELISFVIERFIKGSNEKYSDKLSSELKNIVKENFNKDIGNYKESLPKEMRVAAPHTTIGNKISGAENDINIERKRGLNKINNEIDLLMHYLKNKEEPEIKRSVEISKLKSFYQSLQGQKEILKEFKYPNIDQDMAETLLYKLEEVCKLFPDLNPKCIVNKSDYLSEGKEYYNKVKLLSKITPALARLRNEIYDRQSLKNEGEDEIKKTDFYVNISRIGELKSIQNGSYDLTKLIRYCEELNVVFQNECYLSTMMLVRAIIDHIPPIFGFKSFVEVANNYKGTESFKKSMQHLQKSSRNIADSYLHTPVRKNETLPNSTQVKFSPDLDVLLGEIYRLLKK